MQTFEKKSDFPVSVSTLFDWHERPGAFERLTPPWQKVRVIHQEGSLKERAKVHIQLSLYGLMHINWVLEHGEYKKDTLFVDTQVKGPFCFWQHRHEFTAINSSRSTLTDAMTYKLKLGIGKGKVKKELQRLFSYRHDVLSNDLEVQKAYPSTPKTIAITGASGFIGQQLTHFLMTCGHTVIALTRRPKTATDILWDPEKGAFDYEKLEGVDGVIHLAGENIASGRWTEAKKKRIETSRIEGTRCLVAGLNKLKTPPKVLVSTSGISYYGNHPSKEVNESASLGPDFLSKVCKGWESEALKYKGGRVVTPRLGMVLSPQAGALKKLLLPTFLGLGGTCGKGDQWTPWITIDDVVYGFYKAVIDENISGPINFVAGDPITNKTFTHQLGKALRRPNWFPIPNWLIKLLFGQMAEATLLSSVKAVSKHPIMSKKALCYPDIKSAFKHLLGR